MKNPGCIQAPDLFIPKVRLHYPWVVRHHHLYNKFLFCLSLLNCISITCTQES